MKRNDTTPLWKWILMIAAGSVFFLFLSQVVPAVGSISNILWVKAFLLLAGGLAILGLYAVIVKIFEKRQVMELSLKRAFPDLLTGFAIGAIFIVTVVIILALIGVYRVSSIKLDWIAILLGFSSLFIVAVAEEIIFRGIIFRMVRDRFNIVAAFVVSSLLFGFVHLGTIDLWTAVAISAEAGFMLAAAYTMRDNLWIPVGIHWAWNFISGPVLGLVVSGSEAEYGLIVPEISGSYILSGDVNGFEGSIVTCICGILAGLVLLRRKKSVAAS